jgi:hypothetical protein
MKKICPLLLPFALFLIQCDNWNQPIVPVLEDSVDELRSIKKIMVTGYPYPNVFENDSDLPVAWGYEAWQENGWESAYGLEISGVNGAGKLRALSPGEYTVEPDMSANSADGTRNVTVILNDTHRYARVTASFHIKIESLNGNEHKVELSAADHGKLSASPSKAVAGETIVLRLSPNENYAYKEGSLLIQPLSLAPSIQPLPDGTWTFAMPDEDVRVSAEFIEAAARVDAAGEAAQYYPTLEEAFENAGAEAVITLLQNVALNTAAGISVTGKITLRAADGAEKTIRRGNAAGCLFSVKGADFTLDAGNSRLTLDGEGGGKGGGDTSANSLVSVTVNGKLEMGDRVTLKNNRGGAGSGVYVFGSTFTMNGGEISGNTSSNAFSGGAVYLNNSTFEMNGGEISGNTSVNVFGGGVVLVENSTFEMLNGKVSDNTAATMGGGVLIENSNFRMTSSEISGNTVIGISNALSGGGGVGVLSGTFMMNGGKVSGNKTAAAQSAFLSGGGILATEESVLEITDGEVSGNVAGIGGGISVIQGGTFTMSGGTVSGNTAGMGGGGTYVENSSFTMEDGEISDNIAPMGGGLFVGGGSFTMTSGRIHGNQSIMSGGGVAINSCMAVMTGGEIHENGTLGSGGGVYADNNSSFALSGNGTINRNTAADNGGGVYVNYNGFFALSGGVISGNTANYGGGVYTVVNDHLTISGGIIYGNDADPSQNNSANQGASVYREDPLLSTDETMSSPENSGAS